MLSLKTRVDVADNTGAKQARVIRAIGHIKRDARVGDTVVVHIKEASPDSTVKKGTVAKGVVVRTRYPIKRKDGSVLRFDSNAIVIIGTDGNPKGTRIYGPVARELRQKNFMKILSLAPEVI